MPQNLCRFFSEVAKEAVGTRLGVDEVSGLTWLVVDGVDVQQAATVCGAACREPSATTFCKAAFAAAEEAKRLAVSGFSQTKGAVGRKEGKVSEQDGQDEESDAARLSLILLWGGYADGADADMLTVRCVVVPFRKWSGREQNSGESAGNVAPSMVPFVVCPERDCDASPLLQQGMTYGPLDMYVGVLDGSRGDVYMAPPLGRPDVHHAQSLENYEVVVDSILVQPRLSGTTVAWAAGPLASIPLDSGDVVAHAAAVTCAFSYVAAVGSVVCERLAGALYTSVPEKARAGVVGSLISVPANASGSGGVDECGAQAERMSFVMLHAYVMVFCESGSLFTLDMGLPGGVRTGVVSGPLLATNSGSSVALSIHQAAAGQSGTDNVAGANTNDGRTHHNGDLDVQASTTAASDAKSDKQGANEMDGAPVAMAGSGVDGAGSGPGGYISSMIALGRFQRVRRPIGGSLEETSLDGGAGTHGRKAQAGASGRTGGASLPIMAQFASTFLKRAPGDVVDTRARKRRYSGVSVSRDVGGGDTIVDYTSLLAGVVVSVKVARRVVDRDEDATGTPTLAAPVASNPRNGVEDRSISFGGRMLSAAVGLLDRATPSVVRSVFDTMSRGEGDGRGGGDAAGRADVGHPIPCQSTDVSILGRQFGSASILVGLTGRRRLSKEEEEARRLRASGWRVGRAREHAAASYVMEAWALRMDGVETAADLIIEEVRFIVVSLESSGRFSQEQRARYVRPLPLLMQIISAGTARSPLHARSSAGQLLVACSAGTGGSRGSMMGGSGVSRARAAVSAFCQSRVSAHGLGIESVCRGALQTSDLVIHASSWAPGHLLCALCSVGGDHTASRCVIILIDTSPCIDCLVGSKSQSRPTGRARGDDAMGFAPGAASTASPSSTVRGIISVSNAELARYLTKEKEVVMTLLDHRHRSHALCGSLGQQDGAVAGGGSDVAANDTGSVVSCLSLVPLELRVFGGDGWYARILLPPAYLFHRGRVACESSAQVGPAKRAKGGFLRSALFSSEGDDSGLGADVVEAKALRVVAEEGGCSRDSDADGTNTCRIASRRNLHAYTGCSDTGRGVWGFIPIVPCVVAGSTVGSYPHLWVPSVSDVGCVSSLAVVEWGGDQHVTGVKVHGLLCHTAATQAGEGEGVDVKKGWSSVGQSEIRASVNNFSDKKGRLVESILRALPVDASCLSGARKLEALQEQTGPLYASVGVRLCVRESTKGLPTSGVIFSPLMLLERRRDGAQDLSPTLRRLQTVCETGMRSISEAARALHCFLHGASGTVVAKDASVSATVEGAAVSKAFAALHGILLQHVAAVGAMQEEKGCDVDAMMVYGALVWSIGAVFTGMAAILSDAELLNSEQWVDATEDHLMSVVDGSTAGRMMTLWERWASGGLDRFAASLHALASSYTAKLHGMGHLVDMVAWLRVPIHALMMPKLVGRIESVYAAQALFQFISVAVHVYQRPLDTLFMGSNLGGASLLGLGAKDAWMPVLGQSAFAWLSCGRVARAVLPSVLWSVIGPLCMLLVFDAIDLVARGDGDESARRSLAAALQSDERHDHLTVPFDAGLVAVLRSLGQAQSSGNMYGLLGACMHVLAGVARAPDGVGGEQRPLMARMPLACAGMLAHVLRRIPGIGKLVFASLRSSPVTVPRVASTLAFSPLCAHVGEPGQADEMYVDLVGELVCSDVALPLTSLLDVRDGVETSFQTSLYGMLLSPLPCYAMGGLAKKDAFRMRSLDEVACEADAMREFRDLTSGREDRPGEILHVDDEVSGPINEEGLLLMLRTMLDAVSCMWFRQRAVRATLDGGNGTAQHARYWQHAPYADGVTSKRVHVSASEAALAAAGVSDTCLTSTHSVYQEDEACMVDYASVPPAPESNVWSALFPGAKAPSVGRDRAHFGASEQHDPYGGLAPLGFLSPPGSLSGCYLPVQPIQRLVDGICRKKRCGVLAEEFSDDDTSEPVIADEGGDDLVDDEMDVVGDVASDLLASSSCWTPEQGNGAVVFSSSREWRAGVLFLLRATVCLVRSMSMGAVVGDTCSPRADAGKESGSGATRQEEGIRAHLLRTLPYAAVRLYVLLLDDVRNELAVAVDVARETRRHVQGGTILEQLLLTNCRARMSMFRALQDEAIGACVVTGLSEEALMIAYRFHAFEALAAHACGRLHLYARMFWSVDEIIVATSRAVATKRDPNIVVPSTAIPRSLGIGTELKALAELRQRYGAYGWVRRTLPVVALEWGYAVCVLNGDAVRSGYLTRQEALDFVAEFEPQFGWITSLSTNSFRDASKLLCGMLSRDDYLRHEAYLKQSSQPTRSDGMQQDDENDHGGTVTIASAGGRFVAASVAFLASLATGTQSGTQGEQPTGGDGTHGEQQKAAQHGHGGQAHTERVGDSSADARLMWEASDGDVPLGREGAPVVEIDGALRKVAAAYLSVHCCDIGDADGQHNLEVAHPAEELERDLTVIHALGCESRDPSLLELCTQVWSSAAGVVSLSDALFSVHQGDVTALHSWVMAFMSGCEVYLSSYMGAREGDSGLGTVERHDSSLIEHVMHAVSLLDVHGACMSESDHASGRAGVPDTALRASFVQILLASVRAESDMLLLGTLTSCLAGLVDDASPQETEAPSQHTMYARVAAGVTLTRIEDACLLVQCLCGAFASVARLRAFGSDTHGTPSSVRTVLDRLLSTDSDFQLLVKTLCTSLRHAKWLEEACERAVQLESLDVVMEALGTVGTAVALKDAFISVVRRLCHGASAKYESATIT